MRRGFGELERVGAAVVVEDAAFDADGEFREGDGAVLELGDCGAGLGAGVVAHAVEFGGVGEEGCGCGGRDEDGEEDGWEEGCRSHGDLGGLWCSTVLESRRSIGI